MGDDVVAVGERVVAVGDKVVPVGAILGCSVFVFSFVKKGGRGGQKQ